jgi:uncharacterized protein (DUF2147 family)
MRVIAAIFPGKFEERFKQRDESKMNGPARKMPKMPVKRAYPSPVQRALTVVLYHLLTSATGCGAPSRPHGTPRPMTSKLFAAGALAAASLITASIAYAARTADVTGVWMSQDGRTKVRVTDCGGALCGRIVWLKEPIDPKTGKPRTDKLNPDASKRDRPMLGLQVVNGLRPAGEDKWAGPIYHADEGMVIQVSLVVENEKHATMRGCVLKIVCKSERWTRVD